MSYYVINSENEVVRSASNFEDLTPHEGERVVEETEMLEING